MADGDNRMLCERSFDYTTMTQLVQRDIPIPLYKKRYNEYGQEDIYGEYDANRMYRGYSSRGGCAPLLSLKKKKRKYTEVNNEVTVLLIPSQQRVDEIASSLPVVDTATTTSTVTTSTTTTTPTTIIDDDDDTESSEGELPPGYEAMHTRVDVEPEPPLFIPRVMTSNMPCLECVRRSARGEYKQHEEAIRMRETLRDIKKVLLRTRKTPEDTLHHLEWVKQILAQYEDSGQSSLALNPSLTYASMMSERNPPDVKKQRREPDENIDLEYKLRYDDTDCFYCMACDPECFSRIKHYAWEDHCRMSTHRNAKIEYQEEIQRIKAMKEKEGTT